MPTLETLKVPPEARGSRLDKYLADVLKDSGLSRSALRRLLDEGSVKVDGELRPAKQPLKGGETLTVLRPDPAPSVLTAADIPLDVLFEDEHLIVVNKPAGLVTHPGAGHRGDTFANALLHHCGAKLKAGLSGPRPGIVHRLDKDTTGCLVAAKSEEAFVGLRKLIAAHEVRRVYLALVWGDLPVEAGTIDAPLGRGADRRRMDIRQGGGRPAVTHFRVLKRFADACELECRLETGRTHQIRAHLKSIKHPLVGDPVYGGTPGHLAPTVGAALAEVLGRQALHAQKLRFVHPVSGATVQAQAPEPADYRAARKILKADR
jgi:23S rRNA pseudouridine1911/1915/1917 synthase